MAATGNLRGGGGGFISGKTPAPAPLSPSFADFFSGGLIFREGGSGAYAAARFISKCLKNMGKICK